MKKVKAWRGAEKQQLSKLSLFCQKGIYTLKVYIKVLSFVVICRYIIHKIYDAIREC